MRIPFLLAALLCIGAAAPALAQTKLRIGYVTSLASLSGQGSTKLATVARDLSKGQLEIEQFPSGQLGGELEMLSQVSLGTLDLAMTGAGIVGNVDPAFMLSELPFIWKDGDNAWKVLNGPLGDRMFARLEPRGIKALSWGVWGFRGIMTNGFAVNQPSDLKGRKIRVVENPIYLKTIRGLGGNPVPMAWPEVYSALQQHTIDGIDTNYFGLYDGAMQEVGKNLAVTDHIFTATLFYANLAKFNTLSPELQDVLVKAAKAGGELMRGAAAKANADAIANMEKAGVKITHPDRAAFETALKPVREELAKQVGPALVAEAMAAQQ